MRGAHNTDKPLGMGSYGSIPHLPGSRRGDADRGCNDGEARILTMKRRDKFDEIIVTEKLDGSNVGVARVEGTILPLVRAGYVASSSPWQQHHLFAAWVEQNAWRFRDLCDGERICGEWLALAHGTRYDLRGRAPFVAFDLMRDHTRAPYDEFLARVAPMNAIAPLLHRGDVCSVPDALARLGVYGHYGAIDEAEGCVWRVERHGVVNFLAKYVRGTKIDGKYFDTPTWNWLPHQWHYPQ
jgi:RNA ligase